MKSLVLLLVLPLVSALDETDLKKTLSRDCASSYSATCLKLDVVSWVDKLSEEDSFSVLPGVAVVRDNSTESTADIVAELARDFPADPDARLDAFLLKKISGYLGSHSLRLSLFSAGEARKGGGGGFGGGGGKKGGGGMGTLLAMAGLMKGTLFALALGGLAALAGKALMTALISLLLSAILGLKSLTGGGGKSTTYEVIAKPVISHMNTHSTSHEEHGGHYGHSSYGRSFDVPLPLGLQPGYKPPQ